MRLKPTSSSLPLADLLTGMESGEIQVNPRYQRSGKIWPPKAKSFLVETVLLEMPIPRVLLHDLKAGSSHKSDIIDGQQRCSILLEFWRDKFALTTATDSATLHGKKYSQLPVRLRRIFDGYVVPLDRFKNVTESQIRQVFRRLNFYTAPLNAAEQRHAQFAGEFGRFVDEEAEKWSSTFTNLGVFTKKQRARRAEAQLQAEVVDAMLNGFQTPTAASLRKLFAKYDAQFASTPDFRRRLDEARAEAGNWRPVRNLKLRKHYHIFAFMLAIMHSQRSVPGLVEDLGPSRSLQDRAVAMDMLEAMNEALIQKPDRGRYAKFYQASAEKTNTRENRATRTKYFYAALTGAAL